LIVYENGPGEFSLRIDPPLNLAFSSTIPDEECGPF